MFFIVIPNEFDASYNVNITLHSDSQLQQVIILIAFNVFVFKLPPEALDFYDCRGKNRLYRFECYYCL